MSLIHALHIPQMGYTSFSYFILVGICFLIYFILPLKKRWIVLLAGSMLFYYFASGHSKKAGAVLVLTIVVSYIGGILIHRTTGKTKKALLFLCIAVSGLPLYLIKGNDFLFRPAMHHDMAHIIIPLGVSFYTLQIISYLVDIYRGTIQPQKNLFKYALFVSFFPQIMQGPIPRYGQLAAQLFEGHRFSSRHLARGAQLVLWGFFLKYMIADKAGIVVDTVFRDPAMYQGMFVLVAGILYSIQLYTDFLACVCISRGIAEAFGIQMAENFRSPYFAVSVQDFWRRWHISLSSWLKDYIYIPLGGNRHGTLRKYINLIVTFLVSGIWHGNGMQFLAWGFLHAVYQVTGSLTNNARAKMRKAAGFRPGSRSENAWRRFWTCVFVMLAWIMFRAPGCVTGAKMILSIFTVHNPWILWDDSLLALGLSWKEWVLLALSIFVLYRAGKEQERGVLRDRIAHLPLFLRWILYLAGLAVILVFGTYGFGFDAADFIYRGF